MLVLSRGLHSELTIGPRDGPAERQIVIKILGVDRGQVRLGIQAPDDLVIVRDDAKLKDRKPGS